MTAMVKPRRNGAPGKAAVTRRANKALAEWKAAKPALSVHSPGPCHWVIEFGGLETKSELNQRGAHWAATRRKAAQRERVAQAFLVLRAKMKGRLAPPSHVTMVRVGGKPLDRLVNLPSAFKAIEDEVCKQFGVDDGPTCPIAFEIDQWPDRPNVGVELLMTWTATAAPVAAPAPVDVEALKARAELLERALVDVIHGPHDYAEVQRRAIAALSAARALGGG